MQQIADKIGAKLAKKDILLEQEPFICQDECPTVYILALAVLFYFMKTLIILVRKNCARQQGEFGHHQLRYNQVCICFFEGGENRQAV